MEGPPGAAPNVHVLAQLLDPAAHLQAEVAWEGIAGRPGVGPWLVEVAGSTAQPKPLRLLALVLLRRLIKARWRLGAVQQRRIQVSPGVAFAVIGDQDKSTIQIALLDAVFREPEEQLAANFMLVVATILHFDWLSWPEVMHNVVGILHSPNSRPAQKLRATQLLRTCVKDLASKQLPSEIKSFAILCADLLGPLVRQLLENLGTDASLAYQTAKCLLSVIPSGMRTNAEESRQVFAQAAEILLYPCPLDDLVTNKLWRCLVNIALHSQHLCVVDFASMSGGQVLQRFLQTSMFILTESNQTLPDPNVLSSIRFISQYFQAKELRNSCLFAQSDLERLCSSLIQKWLCLKPEDIREWARAPCYASELDDSLTPEEAPRAAAVHCLSIFFADARTRDVLINVELELLTLGKDRFKPEVFEAVLYTAGLTAFRLRWPKQGEWLCTSLLPLLADNSCTSILQKRAAWTCARFLADFSSQSRPLAYQSLLYSLEFGQDFAVKVAAAEALGDFVRDVDFDSAALDAMRLTRVVLESLGLAERTDAKIKLLDLLMTLSDKLGHVFFRGELGEHCLERLGPEIYSSQQNEEEEEGGLIKFSLLRLIRIILGSVGFDNIQPSAQQVLCNVVEWALIRENVSFGEDGLALFIVVLKSTVTYSHSLHASCMRILYALRGADSMGALSTLIFLGGESLVAQNDFQAAVGALLMQGMAVVDACAVLESLLRVAPAETLKSPVLHTILQGALRDTLSGDQDVANAVDLLAVTAKAVTCGMKLDSVQSRIQLVNLLCDNMGALGHNVAFATYRRRLFCSAMLLLADGSTLNQVVLQACHELHEEWSTQPRDPWPFAGLQTVDCLDADLDYDLQRRLCVFDNDAMLNSDVQAEVEAFLGRGR